MKQSTKVIFLLFLAYCPASKAFLPVAVQHAATAKVGSVKSAKINTSEQVSTNVNIDINSNIRTATALSMAPKSDDTLIDTASWSFDPLFASLWIGFVAFAALGPGELLAESDTALINDYIANPSDPGFSEGFQLIFNYLGIMPIIIACTAVPQAAQRGLPPLPFLVASFATGYGGVGPYLSFRAPPRQQYNPDEASWFTRNILESKLLGWGLVAGVIGLPFYVGLVNALVQDPTAAVQSYTDLFATSKFVSVSTVDAIVLNIAAASLIPSDLKLRQPDVDDKQAKFIGASTLLLPFLGAALYCALRPPLPSKDV